MGGKRADFDLCSTRDWQFFLSGGEESKERREREVKSCLGTVKVGEEQAKKLGLKAYTQTSPALTKCCLRLCAQNSFAQAEENIKVLMGMSVGHSSLHRFMKQAEIGEAEASGKVDSASIDGGKVALRCEGGREWKDYKAVTLSDGTCEAFFQQAEQLQSWSEQLPLSPIFTCLGDGHDGVWRLTTNFGGSLVAIRREVLDWFHLMENLHKVQMLPSMHKWLEHLLWHGAVDSALQFLLPIKQHKSQCFQNYLRKHRQRLPDYHRYQQLGLPIGSGKVESTIKQIGFRVKLAGASWNPCNVPKILRLRTAFLNNSPSLSIST